tara:strand:- start:67 stop:1173 length:1107 start_codon:yes stop_codon:yes gene_type:complete
MNKDIQIDRFNELGIRNPWWINDPEERYWLEVLKLESKDRYFNPEDKKEIMIGDRLMAPHFSPNNPSKRMYTYSLVNFVNKGDIIYHYVSEKKSIVGYSYAKDYAYDGMAYWASKDNAEKPAFIVDLKDYIPFENPITLVDLRQKQNELINYLNNNPQIKYAPFHKGSNIISESYLSKFPKQFLRILNLDYHEGKFSLEDKKTFTRSLNSHNKKRKIKVEIVENPYNRTLPKTKEVGSNSIYRKIQRSYPEFMLEQRFTNYIQKKFGLECTILEIGDNQNDLYINDKGLLIEVKATTSNDALRMVIGQIKHYDYLLSKQNQKPKYVATLLPEQPSEDFINIFSNEKIHIIWETEEGVFQNNLPSHFFN